LRLLAGCSVGHRAGKPAATLPSGSAALTNTRYATVCGNLRRL
jgi:hypothetical protein